MTLFLKRALKSMDHLTLVDAAVKSSREEFTWLPLLRGDPKLSFLKFLIEKRSYNIPMK
jgi:hypothetical protein